MIVYYPTLRFTMERGEPLGSFRFSMNILIFLTLSLCFHFHLFSLGLAFVSSSFMSGCQIVSDNGPSFAVDWNFGGLEGDLCADSSLQILRGGWQCMNDFEM